MQTTILLPLLERKPLGYKSDEFALTKRKTQRVYSIRLDFRNEKVGRSHEFAIILSNSTMKYVLSPPTQADAGMRVLFCLSYR